MQNSEVKGNKKSMKKAFTLAEVLITLVIIGIIAAMTIPALLNNTNKEEYRTGLKKAVSMLQQAANLEYAETGNNAYSFANSKDWYDNFFSKRFNIVSSMPSSISKAVHSGDGWTGEIAFYTADGMAFSIHGYTQSCSVFIDVNGDKKPNEFTLSKDNLKDGYIISIENYNDATDTHTYGAMNILPFGPSACIIGGDNAYSCEDFSDDDGDDYR
ncbi:MAG: type II secretion system protein [Candidatus Gastranaerophilales bacterium]|nr:type II secretion system protein [Candidatus Gastranaerophilales bacterium]